MVVKNVVLYIEDCTEKEYTKKDGSKGKFTSAKVSTGDPFEYPMFLLVNKHVDPGYYTCAIKLDYDRDKNKNNISVAVGDAITG